MLTYDIDKGNVDLGRFLKYYKMIKELTYGEISEKSGIPESTVKKVIMGVSKRPGKKTVEGILKAMDLENILKAEADKNGNIRWECKDGLYPPYNFGSEAVDFDAIEEEIKKKEDPEAVPEMPVIIPDGGMPKTDIGPYTIDDYDKLPDDMRVELINGYFYQMNAPRISHQSVVAEIFLQIGNFIKKHKGKCKVWFAPVDVQIDCDDKTMLEPDIVILCNQEKNIGKCIYGAPDFVAEVLSPSTKMKDKHLKFMKYYEAGVREYWIVDIDKRRIETYFFEESDDCEVYTFDDKVPVKIYGGKLKVDFSELEGELE